VVEQGVRVGGSGGWALFDELHRHLLVAFVAPNPDLASQVRYVSDERTNERTNGVSE
jgi:hypothetical protein